MVHNDRTYNSIPIPENKLDGYLRNDLKLVTSIHRNRTVSNCVRNDLKMYPSSNPLGSSCNSIRIVHERNCNEFRQGKIETRERILLSNNYMIRHTNTCTVGARH